MPQYIVLDNQHRFLRGGPFTSADHAMKYLGPIKPNEELFVRVGRVPDPRPVYHFSTELPNFPLLDVGYRVDDKNNIDLVYVNYCKVNLVHDLRDTLRDKIILACLCDFQKQPTSNNPSLPSAP